MTRISSLRRLLGALVLAACFSSAAPLLAQPDSGGQTDPAAERAATFRAVEGPQVESVPGGVLMISAYTVAWVLLLLYVLRLGRLSARTQGDLARLEKTLSRGTAKGEKAP